MIDSAADTPYMIALRGYMQQLTGKQIEVRWRMQEHGDVRWRWGILDETTFGTTDGHLILSQEKGLRVQATAPVGTFDLKLEPSRTLTTLFTPNPENKEASKLQAGGSIGMFAHSKVAMTDCFWPGMVKERIERGFALGEEVVRPTSGGRLELTDIDMDGTTTKTVFDTSDGFQILSVSTLAEVAGFRNEINATYTNEKVAGVWIPTTSAIDFKATWKPRNANDPGVKSLVSKWAAIGTPSIKPTGSSPPIAWDFNFPNGAKINNEFTSQTYIVGKTADVTRANTEELQAKLAEYRKLQQSGDLGTVPSSGRYIQSSNFTNWIIGVVAVAVVLAAVALRRRFTSKH
jgi:hypothetical protein